MATIKLTDIQKRNLEILVMDARYLNKVRKHSLSDIEIEEYSLQYNPLDKAGSYGIQDGSALFIKKIEGSYENIMGFPLSKFYQFFKNKIK